MKHILFVCTGNTCRSPMAEALFRDLARKHGLEVDIRSAGVSAIDGLPISHYSAQILRDKQIEANLTSCAITKELVDWADLILTMTTNHKKALHQWDASSIDKTYTLKEYIASDDTLPNNIQLLDQLYSELQLKVALGEPVTIQERRRLLELEREFPGFDISDPFGGSLQTYRETATEIEAALAKLVARLQR